MKKFGVYITYPPGINLTGEGLGVHLCHLIRGAVESGIAIVVACPSWSRKSLSKLFESHGIPVENLEFLTPTGFPTALLIREWLIRMAQRLKRRKGFRLPLNLSSLASSLVERSVKYIVRSRHPVDFTVRSLCLLAVSIILLPIAAMVALPILLLFVPLRAVRLIFRKVIQLHYFSRLVSCLSLALTSPQKAGWLEDFFSAMEAEEIQALHKLIRKKTSVDAWYCPTAFWPHFHRIDTPRLMTVPDIVFEDFPAFYAHGGHARLHSTYRKVIASLKHAHFYHTYSEHVKWNTLVRGHGIEPDRVFVIPHGVNRLDKYLRPNITTTNFSSSLNIDDSLAQSFFRSALGKCAGSVGMFRHHYKHGHFHFIFYASQLRPHKNVLTLLKAYTYLLRRRLYQIKLILTGNPFPDNSDILEFITTHKLFDDVLFLPRLSPQELAACYRLARLAVNPSLSEGGFPFTFGEALSVETPVVMAKIPVTLEVVKDPSLQKTMLFDPYNWEDMALKIEYGLSHRNELIEREKPLYNDLLKRDWDDVARQYLEVLDKISKA